MDFSMLALTAVLVAAGFYVLYCVIRAAMLSALRRDRALRFEEELAEREASSDRAG